MSKSQKGAKKRSYKLYPIKNIEDALIVLCDLIVQVMGHLDKYQEYYEELWDIIATYCDYDEDTKQLVSAAPVPEKVFYDLDDKVKYRSHCLFRAIADHQKASFSYANVRKMLKIQGYVAKGLSEDISQLLNEFLDIRNWTFHNTQSVLSASDEVFKKRIPEEYRDHVKVQRRFNPVVCVVPKYFHIDYLFSLSIHMEKRIKDMKAVLESMKKDYIEMYRTTLKSDALILTNGGVTNMREVTFELVKAPEPRQFMDQSDMVVQISMAIQKGQYDGSEEMFNKWVNRKSTTTDDG